MLAIRQFKRQDSQLIDLIGQLAGNRTKQQDDYRLMQG